MPGAMHVQPFGCGLLATADLIAHARIENLRATAGDRAESFLAQRFQCIADRHAKDSLGQMTNLDRGECFDVKLRIEGTQSTQKIQIPFFFQRRMQPPTMCTSVTPRGSASLTTRTISSIAYSKACASRFLAAKAQNWQDKMQMLE